RRCAGRRQTHLRDLFSANGGAVDGDAAVDQRFAINIGSAQVGVELAERRSASLHSVRRGLKRNVLAAIGNIERYIGTQLAREFGQNERRQVVEIAGIDRKAATA